MSPFSESGHAIALSNPASNNSALSIPASRHCRLHDWNDVAWWLDKRPNRLDAFGNGCTE